VDIIILYTPRSLAAQGDENSLRDSIQAVVDSANYSYAKSLIGVRLNPVLIGLHSTWVESGNMLTDMRAMYSDDRIATLRNDCKADFVYLVIESDANFYGGAAELLSDPKGQPNLCMSIMRRTLFAGNSRWAEHAGLGLIHETGHFLGAGHDVEHGYPTAFQSTKALFPYSNGRRFEVGGVLYRTAMAYDPGIQLNLFSNPNLDFAGVPLGIPAGQPGKADNAQTMNRAAPIVAAFSPSYRPTARPLLTASASPAGGSVPSSVIGVLGVNALTSLATGPLVYFRSNHHPAERPASRLPVAPGRPAPTRRFPW
jgi:Metallo-peptidase family M12